MMRKLIGLMLAFLVVSVSQVWAQPSAVIAQSAAATAQSAGEGEPQNPCTNGERRALIFSGGAIKGSFEAGAAWYLVVVRKCDFHDFAGVSVGGFNAALLAQACRTDDAVKSYTCLEAQTEELLVFAETPAGSRILLFFGGAQSGPPLLPGRIHGFCSCLP